jgi:transposase
LRHRRPRRIDKARNYIALGFPSEFESSGDLSRRLEELIVYQLPDDYFERYVARVQAVTAEAVQTAAKTYIQPSRFAVVVVGDRKTTEAGIRALNVGPVRVMTVEEALDYEDGHLLSPQGSRPLCRDGQGGARALAEIPRG